MWIKTRIERQTRRLAKQAKQYSYDKLFDRSERRFVFVAGLQRSGTNMVMDLFDKSWDTEVYREGDSRVFDDFLMKDVETVRRYVCRSPAKCVVIKALEEGHKLRELMATFQPAQCVWMFRHYDDMVNSNVKKWPNGRNQIDDIVKDPDSGGWRGAGMTDETLEIVRRHYRPDMNNASAIGLFWYYRNRLLFDQGLDRDEACAVISYESLVRDPRRYALFLADWCGIEARPAMHDFIFASSIKRDDTPPIEAPIRALCDEMYDQLLAVYHRRFPDQTV